MARVCMAVCTFTVVTVSLALGLIMASLCHPVSPPQRIPAASHPQQQRFRPNRSQPNEHEAREGQKHNNTHTEQRCLCTRCRKKIISFLPPDHLLCHYKFLLHFCGRNISTRGLAVLCLSLRLLGCLAAGKRGGVGKETVKKGSRKNRR